MFLVNCLLYLLLGNDVIGIPYLNLYYTDGIRENTLEHNCLLADAYDHYNDIDQRMILYCLSESPGKFPVTIDHSVQKVSFTELVKANITSENLYHWSAPIDLIEDYQVYLKTNPHRMKNIFIIVHYLDLVLNANINSIGNSITLCH